MEDDGKPSKGVLCVGREETDLEGNLAIVMIQARGNSSLHRTVSVEMNGNGQVVDI